MCGINQFTPRRRPLSRRKRSPRRDFLGTLANVTYRSRDSHSYSLIFQIPTLIRFVTGTMTISTIYSYYHPGRRLCKNSIQSHFSKFREGRETNIIFYVFLLVFIIVMSAMGEVMQVKKLVEFATLPVRGSAFAAGGSEPLFCLVYQV
mgnify:FL=1